MAKIPRLQRENTPSAVTRATPSMDTGLAGDLVEGLGKVVGAGYAAAADAEKEQAEVLRKALAAKQAIVDEVDATTKAEDFKLRNIDVVGQLQKKYADRPELAVDEFIKLARADNALDLKAATNTTTGLRQAKMNAAHIEELAGGIRSWAIETTTRKTKDNVEGLANKSSAVGEQLGETGSGVMDLQRYLTSQKRSYGGLFVKALGGTDGARRLQKLQSDTAQAFFDRRSVAHPLETMNEIRSTTGPAAEFLSADQRNAIEARAKANLQAAPLNREINALREGALKNAKVANLLINDQLTPKHLFGLMNAARAQQDAIAADQSIGEPEKRARLADVDERMRFYKSAESLMLHQTGRELSDKPGYAAEVVAAQAKILSIKGAKTKLRSGQDTRAIQAQYTRISEGVLGGAIPPGAGRTMLRQLEKVLPNAYQQDSENTWSMAGTQMWGADAQEIGNHTINQTFKAAYPKATQSQKNAAWWAMAETLNTIQDSTGKPPTKEDAVKAAKEAVSSSMNRDPFGLFTGKAKK